MEPQGTTSTGNRTLHRRPWNFLCGHPHHPCDKISNPPPGVAAELGAAHREWASLLHMGVSEDHSAMLPFQTQVRRPDPTIWWPEGQWNTMTVPTEVPFPRSTWKVPCRGGCTCTHMPRREERRDRVRTSPWRAGAWQEPSPGTGIIDPMTTRCSGEGHTATQTIGSGVRVTSGLGTEVELIPTLSEI